MKDYGALESHTDTEDATAGMPERTAASVAPLRELTESDDRFRLMADAAPVLIWTCGPDARCSWFNARWLSFVGRPMEQEVGLGWTENVHPEDRERCLEVYMKAFAAREPFVVEYRVKRHDGEYDGC